MSPTTSPFATTDPASGVITWASKTRPLGVGDEEFAASEYGASGPESEGPAVLIVDAADRLTYLTPAAHAAIDDLGGFDHGSLPANLLAVVSSTRQRAQPFSTRTQVRNGRWMSLRAAPLGGGASHGGDVVLTVEPTPRAAMSRLALAAHGLTAREEDVAVLVDQGVNTQGIADALHLSPHTVQDHLKAVFTKLGVTSRREMAARLVLK